jgi:dipeptidyl aminopeptidase/acylaminoacyl peptidase
LTAEDIRKFQLVSNPLFSPDGQWVLYEQQMVDEAADSYDVQLMIVASTGGVPRQLTTAGSRNRHADWSPDGRYVAFISNRTGVHQLWVLPMEGGEARQLTRFRYGLQSPEWAPDGRTIYGLAPVTGSGSVETFTSNMTPDDAKDSISDEDKAWRDGPKRFDKLYFKDDGDGFRRNRFTQLIAVDVQIGDYRQLTSGPHSIQTFAVSPNGAFVAVASNRRNDEANSWWASDLYRVPATGGELQLLNSEVAAYRLSYAPDGQSIAVIGHGNERERYWSAAHNHLFLVPAHGGHAVHVTADFPDTVANTNLTDLRGGTSDPKPNWSPDGHYLYTLSTREGRCEVIEFDMRTDRFNHRVVIGGDRDIYGFCFHGQCHFAISYATMTNPGVITSVQKLDDRTCRRTFRSPTEAMTEMVVSFYPTSEIRLDDSNQELFDEFELVEPEPFYYLSQDDWRIQGWVMKPVGFREGETYPVILEIHGGPQLNYGYAMFHEMQWLAAQGYAVVFTNPRGGMGYGQEFANGVRMKYGQGDAADVLKGLDAALKQFPFLDGTKVAVTGGSYGGFMTNWLVGHSNRFCVAVSQRSISNWVSFYGVSDIGPLFVESQLISPGGNVVDDFEALWQMSPLKYADNIQTPLLLVHSENDLRCPIEQAEQLYTYLKRQGREVELFRVPNASHGLSRDGKPSLKIARLKAIFDYVHGHVAGALPELNPLGT